MCMDVSGIYGYAYRCVCLNVVCEWVGVFYLYAWVWIGMITMHYRVCLLLIPHFHLSYSLDT
ncbi:hypothetical protein EON63_13970 [archaeon]|nr:MAG: hypothetical protein EON63_13970 [archaeon]